MFRKSKSAHPRSVAVTATTTTGGSGLSSTTTTNTKNNVVPSSSTPMPPQSSSPHIPPMKSIGIEPSRHHIGGMVSGNYNPNFNMPQQQQQQPQFMVYPQPSSDQGLSSRSDHEDIKNRSLRQHQKMLPSSTSFPQQQHMSPRSAHQRASVQHQPQQYHPYPNQPQYPMQQQPQQQQYQQQQYQQQQMRNNRMMHLSQSGSTHRRGSPPDQQQLLGQNNHVYLNQRLPQPMYDQNKNSSRSLGGSQRSAHTRTPLQTSSPVHSPLRNPVTVMHQSNKNNNIVTSTEVPWATYTPQRSPHRNPAMNNVVSSRNSSHNNRTSMASTTSNNRYSSPSTSQRMSNSVPNSPYRNNLSNSSHQRDIQQNPMHRQPPPSSPQHFPSHVQTMVPPQRTPDQYDNNRAVNFPSNRLPTHIVTGPPHLPYPPAPAQPHRNQPGSGLGHPNGGMPNNNIASTRNSMASRSSMVNTTTKDELIYFNTNGSAKHIDHTIPGYSTNKKDDIKTIISPPPRPIDDSAGSRLRAFFGTTSKEFVLLCNEDDGNKSWQSKVWCNIPVGLDLKLRTLDMVHFCSFTANDWFLLTQCHQTGKYKSYWNVESSVLHSALTTYSQSNTDIRLVFGENGQYVILHGRNGYQFGPNIPTQLQSALERAYASGHNIVGVHGVNAQGRFVVHLLKYGENHNDSLTSVNEPQQPMPQVLSSFNAQGLSPQLDQILRTVNKAEKLNFVLSIKDAACIMLCDHSFERTDDLHYDLIMELDGFYSRHKKRQENRTVEIEKFYENERLRQSTKKQGDVTDSNHGKPGVDNVASTVDKEKKAYSKTIRKEDVVKAPLVLGEPDLNTEARSKPLLDHNQRSDHKKDKETPNDDKSKKKKKLKPSIVRAQKLLAKEDRLSEIIRKGIKVDDRVTVLGVSGTLGDSVIKSIESNDGSVTVVIPNDGKKKASGDKTTTITEIRRLIKHTEGNEELTKFSGLFQGSLPNDKYEAALELYHIHCKDGSCDCKINFLGSTERFQQPSLWKEGDRVNVLGYTDGTVISSSPRFSCKPFLVHVQYDDGSSYHVRSDQVRPIKRYIDPGSCSFTSLREHEETAVRLRPVLDETELYPFDEYKCPERIDFRRLQRLVANLRADSNLRKECMKSLVVSLDENPNDVLADRCYSQLEHCYDLEEALYMLYEYVKGLPMDDNGCVTYHVQYAHKNYACRGRLFAVGRSVLVLPGKFPRTTTLQGIHAEFRAPLTGAFAHEIDCQNSDVRLLCSLAKQLAVDDMIPSLRDYRDNRESWIDTIQEEHPQVDKSYIQRLVNVLVCGGTYETWLQQVGEDDVVPKLKRFAFRLVSEIQGLFDQVVHHPRFQWTFLERKKLEAQGFKEDTVQRILCVRILQASENEVLGIIHRTFHDCGWIVRTKLFDTLLVECGPNASKEHSTLATTMRIAERQCKVMNWDINLIEKQIHGCEDQPLHSFSEGRSSMRNFLRRSSQGSQCDEDESSSGVGADDKDEDDDDEEDDDDDDLVTTLTRSVGSHSHNDTDEDDCFCNDLINDAAVEAYGNSCESLDLQNESTFHDDSDDEMVHSIEMPLQYRVNEGNNGSKDSMGF